MHWQQVEDYLRRDDRCVFPIGSTEQHAYLSVSTDSILAERIATEAAAPSGALVFPVLHYGITPAFMSFPGTISLRQQTLFDIVTDVLESMQHHGFRRILIVNGHGGNAPVAEHVGQWNRQNPQTKTKFVNWWRAPKTWAKVQAIDPVASHASWMENFPWTRLPGIAQPQQRKRMVNLDSLKNMTPPQVRQTLVDGNYGGLYERSDDDMQAIWTTAVAEIREMIESGWS